MEEVITSIKKAIAGYDGSINNIMLFIFIGKSTPLLMEEMPFFNNLISTFKSDTQVVWGIKQVEESDLLRVAMLFNYSHK